MWGLWLRVLGCVSCVVLFASVNVVVDVSVSSAERHDVESREAANVGRRTCSRTNVMQRRPTSQESGGATKCSGLPLMFDQLAICVPLSTG